MPEQKFSLNSDFNSNLDSVNDNDVKEVMKAADLNIDPSEMSLEALIMLINAERLKHLHDKTNSEFKELKKLQDIVAYLHKLIKNINTETSATGEFDCSKNEELKKLLKEASGMGVEIKEGKFTYTKDERDRLIDNIRMTIDDYHVKNEMSMQTINRLTSERYESYQLARSIMKPLHEDKINKARAINGR